MLTATALITARDEASGVFRRVAQSAAAASGVYSKAAGSFAAASHKLNGTAALTMAMPSALALSSFGHNQYEWDAAIHQYQAISEIDSGQLEEMKRRIVSLSDATGVSRMDLLAAAKGWQELGNSPETFIKNAEVAARTSRVTGITVSEQMKESSALMRAWGHSMKEADTFKHYEEVYLVASKGMKGGAEAFGEAMKSWAPVAAGLGLTFEQASAFAQSLGGQFQAPEIGNALKTGMIRLAAPVPKAKAMLDAAGIDPTDIFSYDFDKAKDPEALIRALKGTGSFTITPAIENLIRKDLASFDLSEGLDPLSEKLNTHLVQALGGHKVSAMDRKILQASLLNFFSAAASDLDPEKFFKAFAPLSKTVGFMSTVFGKEHAAKFMDLLKQLDHYRENLDNTINHAPGALERKWSIFSNENYALAFDRMREGWNNMMGGIGGSGITKDLIGVFDSMSNFFTQAQDWDPATLRGVFWGVAGIAALAPAGYILSGIASSVQLISTLATNPITIVVAGGYLLYQAYENWDRLKELAKEPLKFDIIFPDAPWWLKKAWHLVDDALTTTVQLPQAVQLGLGLPAKDRMDLGEGLRLKRGADRMDFGEGFRRIRDIDGPLQIQGEVTGKVQVEATIKVDGPGQVTNQRTLGGDIKGQLNTGKGMPDSGPSR